MNLLVDGLAFAEAPRWHDGELWFSDFFLKQVLRVDAQGRMQVVADVPMQPSGLGWRPDGRLLVVSMLDRRLMRLDPGGLVPVADLAAFTGGHCNDMIVDARGGAYIGNFGFDLFAEPRQPRAALIVAETFGRRLTAFRVDADGALHDRRVWAELGKVAPDGICLDAEGAVWVASPRSNEFVRVREGGEVTTRLPTDRQAIACTLGGEDGRRLFMISGRVRESEASLADRASRIHWIDVGVPAAAAPR